MNKLLKRVLVGLATFAGAIALTVTPLVAASATSYEECVPSDGVAAYDEVITEAYDEVVTAEHWQRYSAKGSWKEDYAPEFPSDYWVSNVAGDPHGIGVAGPYDVSNEHSGNVDWFYLELVPAVVVHHDAVIVHHDEVPPVVCDDEPEEVEPIACVPSGEWYTESDDALPVSSNAGLVFTGSNPQAVGIRTVASGNLQGWTSVSYSATGDTGLFYYRIVVDASADGGASYSSLTVTSGSPVTLASTAYSNKLGASHTLAEFAEIWPNAVITSVGFHLDSAATSEQSVTLASAAGDCTTGDWTSEPEPEPVVVTALFDVEPTDPGCDVAGSFDTSVFPIVRERYTLTVDRAFDGPGEYTITATPTGEGTVLSGPVSKVVTVLGPIGYSVDSEVCPLVDEPPVDEPPVVVTPPVTPTGTSMPITGTDPLVPGLLAGGLLLAGLGAFGASKLRRSKLV